MVKELSEALINQSRRHTAKYNNAIVNDTNKIAMELCTLDIEKDKRDELTTLVLNLYDYSVNIHQFGMLKFDIDKYKNSIEETISNFIAVNKQISKMLETQKESIGVKNLSKITSIVISIIKLANTGVKMLNKNSKNGWIIGDFASEYKDFSIKHIEYELQSVVSTQ